MVRTLFPASNNLEGLAMRVIWHSLLTVLAFILTAVAPVVPHPFDKLITSLVQLCLFFAELTK